MSLNSRLKKIEDAIRPLKHTDPVKSKERFISILERTLERRGRGEKPYMADGELNRYDRANRALHLMRREK